MIMIWDLELGRSDTYHRVFWDIILLYLPYLLSTQLWSWQRLCTRAVDKHVYDSSRLHKSKPMILVAASKKKESMTLLELRPIKGEDLQALHHDAIKSEASLVLCPQPSTTGEPHGCLARRAAMLGFGLRICGHLQKATSYLQKTTSPLAAVRYEGFARAFLPPFSRKPLPSVAHISGVLEIAVPPFHSPALHRVSRPRSQPYKSGMMMPYVAIRDRGQSQQ